MIVGVKNVITKVRSMYLKKSSKTVGKLLA